MKNTKKWFAGCTLTLMLAAMPLAAFAASTYNTPGEAVAGVTGQTMDQIMAAQKEGKSYAMIAAEAGKLDEFKSAILEIKKDALDTRVAAGALTQDQADQALANASERQGHCGDGTGYGSHMNNGNGHGMGNGYGHSMGMGYNNF